MLWSFGLDMRSGGQAKKNDASSTLSKIWIVRVKNGENDKFYGAKEKFALEKF